MNSLSEKVNENRHLFDIIAGTSAGAINATLIVNHFLQNKERRIHGTDQLKYFINIGRMFQQILCSMKIRL